MQQPLIHEITRSEIISKDESRSIIETVKKAVITSQAWRSIVEVLKD
jgi:hypothetical protein